MDGLPLRSSNKLHLSPLSPRRWSGLSPTAHVEGAQLHRAASVSKGDDPDYLLTIFSSLIPLSHLYRMAQLFG
jgi:hypothetical protein